MILGLQKGNAFKFIMAGNRIEKAFSISAIIFLLSSIVLLGYWALDRTYNRFFVLIMNPLLLFVATLVLRIKLMDIVDNAKDLAKSNYENLGLTIEEATRLFEYRDELKAVRDWFTMIIAMTSLSLLIAFIFPV